GGATEEQAEERLAATAVTTTRESNGALVVRPAFPTPGTSRDSASIRIIVPDTAEVVARSSNGGVRIGGVSGPVHVSTSNGGVEVTDIGGPATIDTSNGAVRVRNTTGGTTVTTSNGSVVAINAGWPLSIRTSNGGITVETAGPGVGTLEARTSNGTVSYGGGGTSAIRSSTSRGQMSLVFDETGPRSSLRSSNGSIRVRLGEPMAEVAADPDGDTN
ncbi:MAG: hypothetical protein KDA22_02800, partial [Phycisphaerales bacterium]|nr:hypothetical protein [Phycisphaerales bacterium]